jgi:methyltransferase (TIGR00027 family)
MFKGRASFTALAVASARALASNPRAAIVDPHDQVALKLLPRPLAHALGAARLAPVVARASLGFVDHLALRTAVLDRLLEDAMDAGVSQVVIVGAGLDSRAHRLRSLANATVYELDHPDSQRVKRARASGLPVAAAALRHVAADLERSSLARALSDAGHDRGAQSFYLLEGLVPYLPRHVVERSLHELADTAAPGSRIAVTYVTPDMLWLRRLRRLLLLSMRALGEPLLTLLAPAEIAALLRNEDFEILRDTDTREWARELCSEGTRQPLIVYERLVVARRR